MTIWQKIMDFIKKLLGNVNTFTTTTTSTLINSTTSTTSTTSTVTSLPDNQDEAVNGLNMNQVTVCGGEAIKNAKIVSNMTKVIGDKHGCTMYYEEINPKWKPHDSVCDGFSCLVYNIDGKWFGGKYDWKRISATTSYARDFKNIINGYKGHKIPPDGSLCGAFLMNEDGTERTSCGFFTWK